MLSLSRSLSSVRKALSNVGIRKASKTTARQRRLNLPQALVMALRPIQFVDHGLLREIYQDAIETTAPQLYSEEQVRAWSALAWLPNVLDRTFAEGSGWISGAGEAFAIRYPDDRLALLYCRGQAARRGHGTALLQRIELDAQQAGVDRLTTEASQLSRPLLERCGWQLIEPETIAIGGVLFERYRMAKFLRQCAS